jgi:hypothetical protein
VSARKERLKTLLDYALAGTLDGRACRDCLGLKDEECGTCADRVAISAAMTQVRQANSDVAALRAFAVTYAVLIGLRAPADAAKVLKPVAAS